MRPGRMKEFVVNAVGLRTIGPPTGGKATHTKARYTVAKVAPNGQDAPAKRLKPPRA